jgi:altronate dehydratase
MTATTLIRLAAEDNIAVAARPIEPGESVVLDGQSITAADHIPTGHKMAIAPIAPGAQVIKYGAPIGSATQPIAPGQYVHIHNVKSDYLPTYDRDERLEAGG